MTGYSCPQCKSERVLDLGHSFACLQCGYQEELVDYREAQPVLIPETTDYQPQIDALAHLMDGLVNQLNVKPRQQRETY